ncbi:levo-lactonase [Magnaporthiopsis poae ATCC 64411]|uniref:Levo-lactonase n=1 Tax=Magnaporthiopsis poae (strain ATCC 64411 / 73-15) TaxID=644358 RepID=A0A0C4DSR9_MAGP6|nr:levo-lactonase [Magnaporthiopsis poae ATCC 64411]
MHSSIFVAAATTLILSRTQGARAAGVPAQAQVINQRKFNALETVQPPAVFNISGIFTPPGISLQALADKPFHVYDDSFLEVIGGNPTLTLIAKSASDPLFHEAVVWQNKTQEMFFAQNAGSPAAGTGLKKSAIVQKISLTDAAAAVGKKDANVKVATVNATPAVINPNGGTNYRGKIVFAGQGQGDRIAPSLFVMDPVAPYKTTVLLNNFFGRQFNSLNDVSVNPRNKDLYFTDVHYGYLQNFRPAPGLPTQVYRFDDRTGAVSVVASDFSAANGLTFSPDGKFAYVTDTGYTHGKEGNNALNPATIYRFEVADDGTFNNRRTFAYVSAGIPDGIHCDTKGNVYTGCGDGVHVFNPSGKLIGKIFLGTGVANFNFAGKGRMVICAETQLYYATIGAEGAVVASEM